MARPTRSSARRRAGTVLVAAATVASGAALLGPGTSSASSHREAPYISSDAPVDNTDVYAFNSPDKTDTATFLASFSPDQDPAGGPNFYPWATDARYNINIDNNGDAKPDTIYRWTFKDVDNRGTAKHGDTVGGTFLYADGPVTTLDDANLLFKQTYDLQVISAASSSSPVTATILANVPVPPDNIGIGTIPDYIPLRDAAVKAGQAANGISSFAGQRDDSFFLDLRIFDLLYGGKNFGESGFNSLGEKNVNTVAIQVPKAQLAAGASVADNPVIGVWSTTERRTTRTLLATGSGPATSTTQSSDEATGSGDFVQVSRLGNPLVNEAVVPANLKDYFNRSTPDQDAKVQQVVSKVQDPEVPYLVQGIYGVPNPNGTAKGKNRPDLVATFLTGISKKSFPDAGVDLNGSDLNKNNVGTPSEMLRLNLSTPAKRAGDAGYSRLGVLGGDVSGFPNGRRLGDDVVDVELQVLEGVLIADQDPAVKKAVSGLGDGVNENDRPYLTSFPYIADPFAGSDPTVGQVPVSFVQNFTSAGGKVTTNVTRISPPAPGGSVQLYRINADGTSTGLGSMTLDSTGTTSTTKTFPATVGSKLTLNYRVFPVRSSAAQFNRGVPTTITVR